MAKAKKKLALLQRSNRTHTGHLETTIRAGRLPAASSRSNAVGQGRKSGEPSAETRLSDSDWETLLSRIKEGKCTPFLGAGANHGILPAGDSIAKNWSDAYEYPFQDTANLSRVSQYVALLKEDLMWPKEEILRLFNKQVAGINLREKLKESTNPLTVLAALPLPVYMTTNYDDFLPQALRFEGKKPQLELCRWNDFVEINHKTVFDGVFTPTEKEPVVFCLHGHQSMPESMVLTEDDYYDFLINFGRLQGQRKLLPPRIEQSLAYCTLLFIGYRLADPDFNVLLRSLFRGIEGSLRRINLAIQLPSEDGRKAQTYMEKYFTNVRVKVYWGDAGSFVTELRSRWEEFNK